MRFLAPIALAGLALLALPVAIHLLVRRRAKLVDFPSLKFLRATRSHQWSPRQLQQPLLLALRLLGLTLLVLGLAQPLRSSAESNGKLTVLLLDASFSMRAGQRPQAAREEAATLIDRLPANERAAVIAFDDGSEILANVTTDRKTLRDAVNRYQPGSGSANYGRVLRDATELLKRNAAGDARLVIVSDFQSSGLGDEAAIRAEVAQLGVRLSTVQVGTTSPSNSYWTNLRVRPGEGVLEVLATETTSNADGIAALERSWNLPGPAGQQPGISWRTEANGRVVGQIKTQMPDSFPDDDQVTFGFDASGRRDVLLVNDGTDSTTYLRAALNANVGQSNIREVVLTQEVRDIRELEHYRLLVLTLRGTPNPETMSRAVQFARSGGTVWLLAGGDLNSESWSQFAAGDGGRDLPFGGLTRLDPAVQPRLGMVDALATPVRALTGLDRAELSAIPFQTGYALTTRPNASVIGRWSNAQSAMVQAGVGHGSIVVLGTSPERTSGGLGLSPVLPQLTGSILASGSAGDTPSGSSVSEASLDHPPSGESEVGVADPGLVRWVFAQASTLPRNPVTGPGNASAVDGLWWRILAGLAFLVLCIEAVIAVARHRKPDEVVTVTD